VGFALGARLDSGPLSYYNIGEGVPQDYNEAYMWISLAASRASGDEQKQYADARELVTKMMPPQQIADAQRRARRER
jgi:TPR repeat protein